MPSKNAPDLTAFLQESVTTIEDVAALDRARTLDHLDAAEYLHFLKQFAPLHPPTRSIPDRHEPFAL